ncbi:hypothetical protein FF1_045812 [Malus domestica]
MDKRYVGESEGGAEVSNKKLVHMLKRLRYQLKLEFLILDSKNQLITGKVELGKFQMNVKVCKDSKKREMRMMQIKPIRDTGSVLECKNAENNLAAEKPIGETKNVNDVLVEEKSMAETRNLKPLGSNITED